MRFLRLFTLLALLLSVAAASAYAQDATPWTVYLYNSSTRELVGVTLDGTQTRYDLGLAPETYSMQSQFPISPDQQLTAYCTSLTNAAGTGFTTELVVRNLPVSADVLRANLGSVMSCSVGGFSADGTQIAVGMLRGFPGDPALDPTLPLWSVMLIDVATGTTVASMDSFNPAFPPNDPQTFRADLPIIRRYDDGEVLFALQPFGTEGDPNAPAYRWSVATGELTPVETWGRFAVDALETTGETVWLDLDPARISGTPFGPMTVYNVVKVTDAMGNDAIVYETGEWLPFDVKFVNGGRQILVVMAESGDLNDPAMSIGTRVVLVDRMGGVTEVGTYAAFAQTAAAPDGYLLMWSEDTGGTTPPPIHLEYRTETINSEIWSILSDNIGISWNIAGSSPVLPAAESLTPFVPIG